MYKENVANEGLFLGNNQAILSVKNLRLGIEQI